MTTALSSIVPLDQEFVFPTYDRAPVVFVRGEGAMLCDDRGRTYLDFLSGIAVNALGYNHPRIVRTLSDQGAKVLHVCNLFHNEYQAPLAQKLCSLSGMSLAFFCNSGTEAVEAAMKVSRNRAFRSSNGKGPSKVEIVALQDSFHGRTLGALSLTGQEKYRKPFEPLIPGIHFAEPNNVQSLESLVNENTCGVILEPIQGEGGIRVLDRSYLKAARSLCDQYKALLIFDEVQCGLGRTGSYFAWQHFGVQPDLITLAKPLGLGLPMGALLGTAPTREDFTVGTHGSTFGGGPLACRLSLEFFRIMEEEQLLEQVRQRGSCFLEQLQVLKNKFAFVKEVRGAGLMLGAELEFPGKAVVREMLNRGFIINCAHEKVLRFLPPYIITEAQIDAMIQELGSVFSTI